MKFLILKIIGVDVMERKGIKMYEKYRKLT